MTKEANLSSLYSSLINYFQDHESEESPLADKLLNELYKSLVKEGHNGSFVMGEDIFIGEEIKPDAITYMHLRPHIYGTILVIIILLGTVGSSLTIWKVGKRHRRTPSPLRILIFNMAASCLLFCIGGIPLLMVENVFGYGWNLGHVTCQLHRYIFYSSFYLISYIQVALLGFLFICTWYPYVTLRYLTTPLVTVLTIVLWLLIFTANIPNFLGHGVEDQFPGVSYCFHTEITKDIQQAKIWTALQFTFTYAFPLVTMVVLSIMLVVTCCITAPPGVYVALQENSINKNKVAIFACLVTASFCICWGPDKIFGLILLLLPRRMDMPLLIGSDVMMCVAYCQPAIVALLSLFSRVDDHVNLQEVKSDQSNPSCNPANPSHLATESVKDDTTEPMMISTV